ncbi:MAG: class I SAM-dependent methyltransferase [Actinomycetia bacterium]|nr:class I SAM-dependent methyltransferase [Actinomycetes bacterium]MCP4962306.1 class I SAM-dependent methyltransferase [Actinomycetes bacterium]
MATQDDDPSTELGLDAAYALATPDDSRTLYAAWADTYDSGFIEANDYVYHRQIAAVFCRDFEGDTVLDVGCGTGVVGVELCSLGVSVIDGIDISRAMLAKAAEKTQGARKVYRMLVEADLTQTIDIADNTYEGLVSAGTFTHGHLGPDSLHELIRVASPGARAAIGINASHFEDHGFHATLDAMVAAGTIEPYGLVDVPMYGHSDADDPNHMSRVAVFDVC